MSVTGYLSLYTTLIGWQQYQNLWNLMVGVGLVFIPFIGIVMSSFLEPFESQEPKSAAVIAMRRLMIRVVGALLVIEFCCVPTVPLNPKVLHFEPACVADAKVATPGKTNTTYDNQFPVPTGVKVPIIWYLVMAVSNGFTHAAITSFSCAPIDYRQLQSQLDISRITDPNLKKETIAFYNDCYIPTYAKYMSGDLSDTQKAEIQRYQQQYGQNDLGWIGSLAFVNASGFYDAFSAKKPIEGFAFDPTRDQFEGQVNNHSQWGQPNCKVWWSDSQNGLQVRLGKALPSSYLTAIEHIGSDPHALMDSSIRHLISHSFDSGMTLGEISRGYESLDDDVSGHWISRYVGGTTGIAMEQMSYYPKLHLLINALPVIQALLLMAIYVLLALTIPFSSYRLHFIITGSAIIFAITFWSYLWHLVLYLDNTLIPAMFPQEEGSSSFAAWLQGAELNTTFVDLIIGTLYIVLPMLFLVLMSWAGLKVSSAIMSALSTMKEPGDVAGDQAGKLGQRLIGMGIGSIKRNIK